MQKYFMLDSIYTTISKCDDELQMQNNHMPLF